MILRWWFRFAFWFRRGWRVPVEALEPWAGDSRTVERRLLIARIALRLAEELRVYPPEVAADILREAAHLVRVERSDCDPLDRASGFVVGAVAETQGHQQSSFIMRVWWALVAFGVTAGLLAFAVAGRADERRVDLYDLRSNRVGAAVVDDRTGRVDLYDAGSRRIGWGRIVPGVRGEPTWRAYGLDGRPMNPPALSRSRGDRR